MFKIKKKEYVNRTIRLEKELFDEASRVCQEEDISLNKLIEQSLIYALERLETRTDILKKK